MNNIAHLRPLVIILRNAISHVDRIQHKFPISLVTWTNKFPVAWTKTEREREKSFEPGLSKGSRGLVGGWQGCYDVLRCAVATKTMRLVTVIVRNVGLCAVTDPVHRPRLRFQPFLLRFPSLDPLQWQAPLHSVAIMERTLIYFRASHDSFWIFFDENFYYAPPGLINGLARANVCTIFIARLDSWNIANIFDTLILGILFLSDAERLRVFFF